MHEDVRKALEAAEEALFKNEHYSPDVLRAAILVFHRAIPESYTRAQFQSEISIPWTLTRIAQELEQ